MKKKILTPDSITYKLTIEWIAIKKYIPHTDIISCACANDYP